MRVTLVGFGGGEDLAPLLALTSGLTAAGHEAVLVAEESGAVRASAAGVEFHGLVGELTDALGTSSNRALTHLRWPDREWLETIVSAAKGSQVVVGLPAAGYHAAAAADQVGAVGVLASLQPMLPTRDFEPAALTRSWLPERLRLPLGRVADQMGWTVTGARVNAARGDLGLRSLPNPYHALPILGAWSPTLVPTPSDWDTRRVTVTGEWHAVHSTWKPTAELAAFFDAEERPLYLGFGSLQGPRVAYAIEAILRAVAGSHRVVLQAHPSITATLPESVLRVGEVSLDWLFPRCGALIHHCAPGVAHAAARSGVPSVPVPFALDQPFWAERLHRLGVASKPVDPRSGWDAYEKPLRETVAARERAKQLAVRMGADAGIPTTITLLESLLP